MRERERESMQEDEWQNKRKKVREINGNILWEREREKAQGRDTER